METVLSIHERIKKSLELATTKQVSSSSICKYNLLQKGGTLRESLHRPWKVSRTGARTEIKKMYTIQKKANVYYKLDRKRQCMMASARPRMAKFQDLGS